MAADQISRLGIVGAGFMGTGVAECAAAAGISVVMHDSAEASLERSQQRIDKAMARSVEKERRTEHEAAEVAGRISWSDDLSALAESELVIEAIVENLDAKTAVFAELDEIIAPAAIIASNTSSIPIAELAAVTERPGSVIGLHFFSPVPQMRLLELVVALDTAEETIAASEGFADQLGKSVIRTKDRSGFVVNFLLVPYLMAAIRMYEDGFADRESIDEGMRLGCGHPMGPLALCDLIGLDVLYSVCDSLFDEFKRDEYAPPPLMKRMVAAGRLGQKAGRGFYEYDSA